VLQTFAIIIGVSVIKYQLIKSYNKLNISLLNLLLIITSFLCIFIFSTSEVITKELKYVLSFTREILFNFGI